MTFGDIPDGTAIFVDANVFVYALSQQVVAAMQANGISSIASHDADFDHVPGLTRYAPA
jgi:predicted nucleic acid-binding protein